MKMEYKLVQWYPSLPSDWEKGMLVGQGDRVGEFSDFSPCSSKYTDKRLHYKEVRTNSKFWEKVVPKEFEILILSYSDGELCYLDKLDGHFKYKNMLGVQKKTGESNMNNCLKGGWSIYSIKRLSDGEIFTIGDRVKYYKRKTKIEKIYYNEHNQLSFKVEGDSAPLTGCFSNNMPRFKKLEGIVLTTEDDVDLITGDRYFVPQVEGKHRRLSGNSIAFYVEPDMPENDTKRFAKEENAQVYIENNIELFSAKDIHELLKKYSRMMVDSSVYLELSRMVKERLNGNK